MTEDELISKCSQLKTGTDTGRFVLKGNDNDIIAMVNGFDFEEADAKVILQRCDHTESFPNDLPFDERETYSLLMKNIDRVDVFKAGK